MSPSVREQPECATSASVHCYGNGGNTRAGQFVAGRVVACAMLCVLLASCAGPRTVDHSIGHVKEELRRCKAAIAEIRGIVNELREDLHL